MLSAAKLALGTVQWGMRYGLTNKAGMPARPEIEQMLQLARERGVSTLDTACVYGEAESVLGSVAAAQLGFQIVTKTCPAVGGSAPGDQARRVADDFRRSLARMHCKKAYGLLVHHAGDLLADGGYLVWRELQSLKAQGLVEKIGVSVYSPEEADALSANYALDLIQLPLSIYDQRFLRSGVLALLRQRGVEIHTRSALLQGLLLIPSVDLPAHFDSIREHQRRLHGLLATKNVSPLAGALAFCLLCDNVDRVVVGCETLGQLREIFACVRAAADLDRDELAAFAIDDTTMTVPSTWPPMPEKQGGARSA